jgi:BNR repeat-like domain
MRCLLCFVTLPILLPAQGPLPPAPKASIVDISPPDGAFTEPGIAINPKRPNEVLAVYQVGPFAAYSSDSGKTFSAPQALKPPDYRVSGDVSTTFDDQGHAFLCYLAFDKLGTPQYWAHGAGRNGIFLRRSLDGGKTWENDAIAIRAFPTGHEPGLQFEDQARIFADTGERSPYSGRLYAGWIEWQLQQSIILFSTSTDAGKTWSPALRISTHAGLPRDDNGAVGGIVAAVAPDGTIYAAWHDGNWITLTVSHDGGRTFSPSRGVIETAPPYFGDVPSVSRVCGFPQIGIDPSGRNLYLAWSDYRNGDIDVFIAGSSDQGRHWSRPVRVNDDPLHDGADQFFQWMAVDPISGAVYVQFYDRRNDPEDRKTRFTLARSTDGARTFTNYGWATNEFDSKGAFMGDYTWLAAYNHRVYGAWTEARPQVPPQLPSGTENINAPQITTVIRVGTADFSGVR